MNDKILVSYFSKGGATEEYAKVIAEKLISDGLSVETFNLANKVPDIASFRTVILGAGVRMGMVYRQFKKVLKHKEIKEKNLYLFLSSGMAAEKPDEAVEKYLFPLADKYKLKTLSMVSFPGKMPEKWAKYDDSQKMTTNPDLAKKWAEEISRQIQRK